MPALVNPAIRPASTTARPPGTGTAPPMMEAIVMTTRIVVITAEVPQTDAVGRKDDGFGAERAMRHADLTQPEHGLQQLLERFAKLEPTVVP
jgi:hypothetical protein